MKSKRVKLVLKIVSAIAILSILAMWFSNKLILKSAEGKTFSKVSETPYVKTGLLLGTSKLTKHGNINHYFQNRINATTELFKSGKIKYLIISGDNGKETYDEPTDMKQALIQNGIDSTRIFLDYAGFRTFDSMIRAKEIFGQDSLLIISQQFHNERALYIAEKYGISAYGYNAADVEKHYSTKTNIREKFARVKVILDFIFGTKPKFLGKKITIE